MHLMNGSRAFTQLRVVLRPHPVDCHGNLSCTKRHHPCTDDTMQVALGTILVMGVERSPTVIDPQIAGIIGVAAELKADQVMSGVAIECR